MPNPLHSVSSRARGLVAIAVVLASGAALAQSAPAPSASAASAAQRASNVRVLEDDNVRIEETRNRGQPQRITVQNKVGIVKGYEIIVPAPGKDSSQARGAGGQRAWSLFDF